MDQKQELLILLRDYEALREMLKQKAWEITPEEIKRLLCGNEGLLANNSEQALEWLITPDWRLDDKCPVEVIIENKTEEVIKLLKHLLSDVYD